jgi:hypothetical protein
MAAVVGLTLIKKFTYRGDASEEYSNQYWLSGSVPADAAAWLTLANSMIALEKTVYPSSVAVVQAYGYDSDAADAVAVYSLDLHAAPVAGTLGGTGGLYAPGDDAVWVRWHTSRLSSKGKRIYLRKYFHPVAINPSVSPDEVVAAHRTALSTFAGHMYDGTISGSRNIRSQGHAETITAHDVGLYVTTRTLKRRGKRPTG